MKRPRRGRKPPQRTCAACKTVYPKRELVRIVRTEDGVKIDLTGRKNGRGAYLCRQRECWGNVTQSDALNRALRSPLTTGEKSALVSYAQHLL